MVSILLVLAVSEVLHLRSVLAVGGRVERYLMHVDLEILWIGCVVRVLHVLATDLDSDAPFDEQARHNQEYDTSKESLFELDITAKDWSVLGVVVHGLVAIVHLFSLFRFDHYFIGF